MNVTLLSKCTQRTGESGSNMTDDRRLRAELETVQAKIHDDVTSGSNWAKARSRMEVQYKVLSESFEEAVAASREAENQ